MLEVKGDAFSNKKETKEHLLAETPQSNQVNF
jgi:hypothetical protein